MIAAVGKSGPDVFHQPFDADVFIVDRQPCSR